MANPDQFYYIYLRSKPKPVEVLAYPVILAWLSYYYTRDIPLFCRYLSVKRDEKRFWRPGTEKLNSNREREALKEKKKRMIERETWMMKIWSPKLK